MKRKKETGFFLGILFLAFCLRISLIEYADLGMQMDEMEVIVEAQTLLETGKDKEGYKYPLYFSSFEQGEAPLLSYVLIPFFVIFGDSNQVALAVMIGISMLTVISVYVVARQLFGSEIALGAMFFLSISPWHLNMSRLIYNITLLILVLIIGYASWEKGWKKKNSIYCIIGAIIFGLGFYSYPLAWLWVFIWLVIWYISKYMQGQIGLSWKIVKFFLPAFLSFLLLVAPLGIWLFFKHNAAWNFYGIQFPYVPRVRAWEVTSEMGFIGIWNYIKNYFVHFSPEFWFASFNSLDFTPYFGLIYIVQAPLVLLGFWYMYQNRKETSLVWLWFFAAWIPSALTHLKIPHPLRTAAAIPVISIISSFGLRKMIDIYKRNKYKKRYAVSAVIFGIIFLVNIVSFQVYHNTLHKKIWLGKTGYGAKEVVDFVEKNRDKYETIIIDPRYIHWIHFSRYSREFREEFQRRETEELEINEYPKKYGNIHFCEFQDCTVSKRTLFITKEKGRTEGVVVREIQYPDSDQVAVEIREIK